MYQNHSECNQIKMSHPVWYQITRSFCLIKMVQMGRAIQIMGRAIQIMRNIINKISKIRSNSSQCSRITIKDMYQYLNSRLSNNIKFKDSLMINFNLNQISLSINFKLEITQRFLIQLWIKYKIRMFMKPKIDKWANNYLSLVLKDK